MDWSFLITIGLVFLVALVGAYLRSSRKDRCLRSYDGFHVTLERSDGKLVWGVLRLAVTGMEFNYQDSVQDDKHIESSYLLYASEYGDIQAIYRYADKLSPWGKAKREADIRRSFHPSLPRRFLRSARNFLNTAADSANEVIAIVLGRMQKSGGRYLTDQGSAALGKLGGQVLGHVGAAYDPLLERYIGQRVVIEVLEGDEVHEHVGIFKEYSPDFIEVLNVQYPQVQTLALSAGGVLQTERLVAFANDGVLELRNEDSWPVLVESLHDDAEEHLINAVVDSGETVRMHIGSGLSGGARVRVQVVRELDMIVPRTRCVVRHRAEHSAPEKLSALVLDVVFDVGVAFSAKKAPDAREARLRAELARDPKDALAAANLGSLLLRNGDLAEAEKWLRQALSLEYSLPDGGRRVRMELREIERRLWQEQERWVGAVTDRPADPAVAAPDDGAN